MFFLVFSVVGYLIGIYYLIRTIYKYVLTFLLLVGLPVKSRLVRVKFWGRQNYTPVFAA